MNTITKVIITVIAMIIIPLNVWHFFIVNDNKNEEPITPTTITQPSSPDQLILDKLEELDKYQYSSIAIDKKTLELISQLTHMIFEQEIRIMRIEDKLNIDDKPNTKPKIDDNQIYSL